MNQEAEVRFCTWRVQGSRGAQSVGAQIASTLCHLEKSLGRLGSATSHCSAVENNPPASLGSDLHHSTAHLAPIDFFLHSEQSVTVFLWQFGFVGILPPCEVNSWM